MDELSDHDHVYFRELLERRRADLQKVAGTASEAAGTVKLDQSRVGRLSHMDALQAQAMSQESNRRREQELHRTASAMRRLEEGEYGFCMECSKSIARNRLEADPCAALCIDCASRAEKS